MARPTKAEMFTAIRYVRGSLRRKPSDGSGNRPP